MVHHYHSVFFLFAHPTFGGFLGGVQIDLLIDRRDDVINLCEMKCTDKAFEITKEYRNDMINKVDTFIEEARPDKSVHVTMITSNGLKENRYTDVVQNNVRPESLFNTPKMEDVQTGNPRYA